MAKNEQELRQEVVNYLNVLDESEYRNIKLLMQDEISLKRLIDVILEKMTSEENPDIEKAVDEIETNMYFD